MTDDVERTIGGVRLAGAIFLRAEYTAGWAYRSPPAGDLASLLRPGRKRLVLFHIVASGRCWVATDGGDRHWADAGDVIVLPYGEQHTMGGPTTAEAVDIAELIPPTPWRELPVIRHGGGGERTDVVCGYLDADAPLFDPGLHALPSAFVVRPSGSAATWVEASVAFALDHAGTGTAVSERLPELLLAEILRIHLSSGATGRNGWLAALSDPVLAPALAALHERPEQRWTVDALAEVASVSRSLLDRRCREVLGMAPIRYLLSWRMHVAGELLATSDLGVGAIARRVGYEHEEAFSRAFKRELGMPPSTWRRVRRR